MGTLRPTARIARYAANTEMAPHRHEEPWFCVVLRGGYEERIRAASHAHVAGDMLFCPAQASHAQRFGPGGAIKLLFSPSTSSLDYLAACRLSLADAPHIRSPAALGLAARLVHELKIGDGHSELAAEGLTLELVAAFARADRARTGAPPPPWLRRAREILEDGGTDSMTLGELGTRVARHPVHVAKEFRRHYGLTVGAYLREKRAARAALLLRKGNLSLTEVALTCGFGGSAQFTRAFKAVFGVTPSAYRAEAR